MILSKIRIMSQQQSKTKSMKINTKRKTEGKGLQAQQFMSFMKK